MARVEWTTLATELLELAEPTKDELLAEEGEISKDELKKSVLFEGIDTKGIQDDVRYMLDALCSEKPYNRDDRETYCIF